MYQDRIEINILILFPLKVVALTIVGSPESEMNIIVQWQPTVTQHV